MDSVILLDTKINKDEYYNIWCENYLLNNILGIYKQDVDPNNLVLTTFHYYIDHYGGLWRM